MFKENSKLVNINLLVCAIIKCAIDDYKASLREETRFQGKGENIDHTAEYFFKSEYFKFLANIDGEVVLKLIRENKFTKRKNRRFNNGR